MNQTIERDFIWVGWLKLQWTSQILMTRDQLMRARLTNVGGYSMDLTVVYGANNCEDCRHLWGWINNLREIANDKDWIMIEDFSEMLVPEECDGRGDFDQIRVGEFNSTTQGFLELNSVGGFYTWTNGFRPNHARTKLDWMFGNRGWLERWPHSWPLIHYGLSSDHVALILKVIQSNELELYKVGGFEVESHLIYGDDHTLFCRASWRSFHTMKCVLNEFYEYMRLTMNQQKSFIMVSASVTNGPELAAIAGIQLRSLPIQHLGIHVTGCTIHHVDCARLIEMLEGTMNRWKNKSLSNAGRVQLLQWLFAGIFNCITQSAIEEGVKQNPFNILSVPMGHPEGSPLERHHIPKGQRRIGSLGLQIAPAWRKRQAMHDDYEHIKAYGWAGQRGSMWSRDCLTESQND